MPRSIGKHGNFRTICEVHREIYEILAKEPVIEQFRPMLIDKTKEAYGMAKKMNAKLKQYKCKLTTDWYENNKFNGEDIDK